MDKMPFALAIIFSSFTVYGISGCDMEAPLPKANPPLNFNKPSGTWYETVTTIDDISLNFACAKISDIHLTPTGHEDNVIVYYGNGKTIEFHIHSEHTKDGYYRQEYVERNEDLATSYDENGHINPGAALEQYEMKDQKYTLLGDLDQYFAYVRCAPTGWTIWVFTKEKKVTPEKLVYIRNDLLKHGITAPLRLGSCENVA